MPDLLDAAAELEESDRGLALQRHRQRAEQERSNQGAAAPLDCQDCGDEIPAARRATGHFFRCIDCQVISERLAKRFCQ